MNAFSDLWEEIDYHSHREQLKETFGHLAPEKNKTYKGRIVYAVGCFADDRLNPVAIVAEFDGLESSPWFFEAVMDFLNGGNAPTGYDGFSYMIGDLKNEDGCIYEWVGTLRNYKFTGQRRLLLNVNNSVQK